MPAKRKTKLEREQEWPKLPRWNPHQAMLIEQYLLDTFETRKPPEVAARLLAFIITLDNHANPFPERECAARWLNCSRYSIDAAISVALGRKLITTEVKTTPSLENTRRPGIIRHRYYVPTTELLIAADALPKRQRAA